MAQMAKSATATILMERIQEVDDRIKSLPDPDEHADVENFMEHVILYNRRERLVQKLKFHEIIDRAEQRRLNALANAGRQSLWQRLRNRISNLVGYLKCF